jgi:hypothetical protein
VTTARSSRSIPVMFGKRTRYTSRDHLQGAQTCTGRDVGSVRQATRVSAYI